MVFNSLAVLGRTKAIVFLLSIVLGLVVSPLLHAKAFTFIYISASDGNASGGHTALRFANDTYHFQHYDGGIIRLVKDSSADFDFQYRYLENRTFYQATLDLEQQDYEQLHNHFNLRFIQQKQQDAIRNEIDLNIALLSNQTSHPQLTIKGTGLFDTKTIAHGSEAQTISKLQQQIAQHYSADYLSRRIEQLKSAIASLQPQPWAKNSLQFSIDTFSPIPYSFATRYLDSVSKLWLLEIINNGNALNQQAYFSPESSAFNLAQTEITELKYFQRLLTHDLLSLLGSNRPDWGSAAFSLYARILTLTLAIDSGKLVFLDSFRDSNPTIPYTEVAQYKENFLHQQQQALTSISQLKKVLFSQANALTEQAYGQLEMQSNYYYERERGLKNRQSIRISGEQRLATKSITLPADMYPVLGQSQTTTALARFKAYQKKIDQQLKQLYSYDLFTRNCVTEITSTVNQLATHNQQITELSQLTDKDLIAFIPFGSFRSLSGDYTKQTLPSFRHQQLKKMYAEENDLLVFLREFNTLSATNYKFNEQDAAFLIFTDNNILLRPIFGSINLIAATTVSIYGSLALAFDSGKALKDGTMGILMSLPELAFFNIRKGSYKHLSFPAN